MTSILLLMGMMFTPHSTQGFWKDSAAQAQSSAATVQNVRVLNSFAHSLILRWDAPANSGLASLSGYYVTWRVTGQTAYEYKVVTAYLDRPNAFQIQPLDPAKTYSIGITPMDCLGGCGATLTLNNQQPKGTYEAALRTLTGNGTAGFLYLPENDAVNGRINPLKINPNIYNMYSGDAKGAYFEHSSMAVNNQQHWHMIGNDYGTGSITARVKGVINLADGGTRHLHWDCDAGPYARQTWYIILTPNKVDQFLLFPNNGDAQTQDVWPREQIQIKFAGEFAHVTRYSNGFMITQQDVNWRQYAYLNVRQRMELDISPQGIKMLADVNYDNAMQLRGTFASDISAWKSCYAYFTLGSYNNRKSDDVQGMSATGKPMLEFQGANMHWGSVAFDAPAGSPTPTELTYYEQPDLKARSQGNWTDLSHPVVVNIPDKIPADAVARELVFTDRNGCIPCLSGRDKLRLTVNGTALANKKEAAAWNDYPTYRWLIPAGLLRQGQNIIVFGQIGVPDPIGITNLHIDIHVPPTSPAIAAYTKPAAHSVLETMPDHTELEGWTAPFISLTLPKTILTGRVFLPIVAHSVNTAHLAGSPVAFDKVWAEVNGKTVWSQDTNATGVGTLTYQGGFWLDTATYPSGYYEIVVKAHSKSGSLGFSNGTGPYNYDATFRVMFSNGTANKIAPIIKDVNMGDLAQNKTIGLKQGDTFYVRSGMNYNWSFNVVAKNPLQRVEIYLMGADGKNSIFRAYNPAMAAPAQVAAGMQYAFGDGSTLWGWWPFDKNGQEQYTLLVTDVYGNQAGYRYNWSLVPTPPAPPAVAPATPPSIAGFSSDPPTVKSGWACLISWASSNGSAVTIDNGIGAVGASGKVCITPLQTTTYTLTVTNAKGTVKRSITVNVVP